MFTDKEIEKFLLDNRYTIKNVKIKDVTIRIPFDGTHYICHNIECQDNRWVSIEKFTESELRKLDFSNHYLGRNRAIYDFFEVIFYRKIFKISEKIEMHSLKPDENMLD